MDCLGTYFAHTQPCENLCLQSATEWIASVHTIHMPKHVIYDSVRAQSATEWTASVGK